MSHFKRLSQMCAQSALKTYLLQALTLALLVVPPDAKLVQLALLLMMPPDILPAAA
jgi:hypothetical protein